MLAELMDFQFQQGPDWFQRDVICEAKLAKFTDY